MFFLSFLKFLIKNLICILFICKHNCFSLCVEIYPICSYIKWVLSLNLLLQILVFVFLNDGFMVSERVDEKVREIHVLILNIMS